MALRDRLRDRLGKGTQLPHSTAARRVPRAVTTGDSFQDLKARIHRKLIERLDPDTRISTRTFERMTPETDLSPSPPVA